MKSGKTALSACLLLIVLTLAACAETMSGSGGAGLSQGGATQDQAAGEEKDKSD
jgi:hypothetical protein